MPKASRIAALISASSASSDQSESHPLVTIALFCGIGLLASLVEILMGVPIAWY
jgi:hypothetical protein